MEIVYCSLYRTKHNYHIDIPKWECGAAIISDADNVSVTVNAVNAVPEPSSFAVFVLTTFLFAFAPDSERGQHSPMLSSNLSALKPKPERLIRTGYPLASFRYATDPLVFGCVRGTLFVNVSMANTSFPFRFFIFCDSSDCLLKVLDCVMQAPEADSAMSRWGKVEDPANDCKIRVLKRDAFDQSAGDTSCIKIQRLRISLLRASSRMWQVTSPSKSR